jgi:hypothetical protein
MRQALVGRPLFAARSYVLDPRFALFENLISHGTAFERERPRSRRRLGPQSSPDIGEKLKELLTAKPASYSEDKEPRMAEKDQMSAPQEEFIQKKLQPSKSKEK